MTEANKKDRRGSQESPSTGPQRRNISIGTALILGISGIIIAVIIAVAIIVSSGVKALRDFHITDLDGFKAQVQQYPDQTVVDVNINKGKNISSEKTLLQQCPQVFVVNKMPSPTPSSPEDLPRTYYILEGERKEITEFDGEWLNTYCNIETEVVY